jgi:hypothetical protein
MIDMDLTKLNVTKARELTEYLSRLGSLNSMEPGRLGADLSDLYAAATQYQRLIDALLQTPPEDGDRLGDVLADLYEELQHLSDHIASALPSVDALAERFD